MAVHAGAGALVPGGMLVVYGAKDEGIGSAGRRLEGVMDAVRTLATGAHCRVLAADRPERPAGLRGRLEDWRRVGPLEGVADRWVSYPGVFAHGRLDRGTALLLAHLPPLEQGARILDFGCGAGPLAAVCQARARDAGVDVAVDGLDVDAVALTAFLENVPEAGALLAAGLGSVEDGSYPLVISNPPYHRGKAESTATLAAFVADSPRVLTPGGRLVLVVQRRLPVKPMLEGAFATVRALAADSTYQIWEAVRG